MDREELAEEITGTLKEVSEGTNGEMKELSSEVRKALIKMKR